MNFDIQRFLLVFSKYSGMCFIKTFKASLYIKIKIDKETPF